MQCTSCGAALPTGAKHCPNCGAPIPAPTSNYDPFQETVPNFPGYQPGEAIPGIDPYNAAHPQQPVPSSPDWQANQPAVPGQPTFYPGMQPPYQPQLPPSSPRRGLSSGMVILIIVLAILVIASGVGLIYYSTVYHPAQIQAQATATTSAAQTVSAQTTSTANTQASNTAVAQANVTGTANAQATAVVVATQTALQNIYTTSTQGNPAINDSLSGNSNSNWDVDSAQGGGGCSFSGGAYHASLDAKGFYFPCAAENTNVSNFAFQVNMNIDKGDAGGLLFRSNRNSFQFYALQINSDGSYNLFVSKDQSHNSNLLVGTSTAYKKGQTNLIAIVARGSNFYIYINKQYTGSVNDGTYASGQIGVLVDDRTNPTDVAYTNAQVWTL